MPGDIACSQKVTVSHGEGRARERLGERSVFGSVSTLPALVGAHPLWFRILMFCQQMAFCRIVTVSAL